MAITITTVKMKRLEFNIRLIVGFDVAEHYGYIVVLN